MEDIVLFKKTVADILHLINFPQNEIATYADTLLEHALTDTLLDFSDTLSEEEQKTIEHLLHVHPGESVFAELVAMMEKHHYEHVLRQNMKEQMIGFVDAVLTSTPEPEAEAIRTLLTSYLFSFSN